MFGQQFRKAAVGVFAALALGGSAWFAPQAFAAEATPLVGTFSAAAGACSGGNASGSYFRMVQPSGTVAAGPFVSNADSACGDQTYTLFTPGTDGGFVTGGYQPAPTPNFDGNKNSLAGKIIKPVSFFNVKFGLSTDPTDLQTKTAVAAPSVTSDGNGGLTGDLRAWSATWNEQYFNQGSPKPDGGRPALTTPAKGTYNASTGAYTIEWTSTINGGPFNNFTGVWHFTGTFKAAGTGAAPASSGGGTKTTTASGTKTTVAGSATDATTTTVATTEEAAAGDDSEGTTEAIAAVDSKGWKPPAWLIVVTALAGVVAAGSLLRPTKESAEQ